MHVCAVLAIDRADGEIGSPPFNEGQVCLCRCVLQRLILCVFYSDAFREIFLIEETAASSLHTNHSCQSYPEPLP